MAGAIHILAACTERKRAEIPSALRLRSIRGSDVAERAKAWWKQLEKSNADVVRAQDLYAGDHWAVARELPEVAAKSGLTATLWVISAGYGLISAETEIHPYSATFGRRATDSIWVSPSDRQATDSIDWWRTLSEAKTRLKTPRSVEELVRRYSEDRVLVIAGPDYVEAITPDLLRARHAMSDPERLLVVSSRTSSLRGVLAQNHVLSDARLQAALGGAKGSLNARIARKILEDGPRHTLDAGAVTARFRTLVARAPELETYDRRKMTDEHVVSFLRRELEQDSPPSCTALLRKLRDSGRACEQHRFKALYRKTAEEMHVRN